MHRCHRLALTALVLGVLAFALLGSGPAQAQENPGVGWFDALVHTFMPGAVPRWWADRSGDPQVAVASRPPAPSRIPPRAPRKATASSCYSGTTDPDGNCPH